MVAIGFTGSAAVWAGYVVAPVGLTCAWIALLSWQRLIRLPIVGWSALLLIPAITWLLPLTVYAQQHPNDNPLWWVFNPDRPKVDVKTAFEGFVTLSGQALLGIIRPTGRAHASPALSFALASIACVAILMTLFQASYRRNRAAMLTVVLAVATVGAFIFGSFGYPGTDVRYILPLFLALPLLVAALIAGIRRASRPSRWATLALLCIVVINGASSFGDLNLQNSYSSPEEADLAQALEQHDIRYIHTSYWYAMSIMFESGGRITASSRVGPNRTIYDPQNEARVLAAEGKDTAFVFSSDGSAARPFEEYLKEQGIRCQQRSVRNYYIFEKCQPFPSIDKLVEILPGGGGF